MTERVRATPILTSKLAQFEFLEHIVPDKHNLRERGQIPDIWGREVGSDSRLLTPGGPT